MKKINLTNKIYVVILLTLIIATVVKILSYSGWSRYYYGASVTAPRNYPVYIHNAYFILTDGDINAIATGDVNNSNIEWGEGEYQSPTTKEQLPVKLVLEYASYRDKLFYADTISLPQQTIKNIFSTVNQKGVSSEPYGLHLIKRFDFVIGVANKGNIIVWIQGLSTEVTLLTHKITPREPVGNQTYYNGQLSKEKYFQEVFHIDSAKRADFAKGIDKDANYIDTPSHFKIRVSQHY